MTVTGLAVGSGTVTLTATDPAGLSVEWSLAVSIDDTGLQSIRHLQVPTGQLPGLDEQTQSSRSR